MSIFDKIAASMMKVISTQGIDAHSSPVATALLQTASEVDIARINPQPTREISATSPISSQPTVINYSNPVTKLVPKTIITPDLFTSAEVITLEQLKDMEFTSLSWSAYQILPDGGFKPTSNVDIDLRNPNKLDQQGKFMRMLESIRESKVADSKFDGYLIQKSGDKILLTREFSGKKYLNIVTTQPGPKGSDYMTARKGNTKKTSTTSTVKYNIPNPIGDSLHNEIMEGLDEVDTKETW